MQNDRVPDTHSFTGRASDTRSRSTLGTLDINEHDVDDKKVSAAAAEKTKVQNEKDMTAPANGNFDNSDKNDSLSDISLSFSLTYSVSERSDQEIKFEIESNCYFLLNITRSFPFCNLQHLNLWFNQSIVYIFLVQ